MEERPPFVPQDTPIREEIVGSTGEVRTRCELLRAQDKAAEAKQAALKKWMWIWGIITFVGAFFIIGFFFMIPLFITIYRHYKHGRKDFEDRKLDIVCHLIEVLGPELSQSGDVRVMVDFNGYANGRPVSSERNIKEFRHNWLEMDLPVGDGGTLSLVAATYCKRKIKRKRKYTRDTDKLQEFLYLKLTPAKGTVFNGQKTASVAKMLAGLSGLQCRFVKIRPKTALVELRTDRAIHTNPPKYGMEKFSGGMNLLHPDRVLRAVVLSYRGLSGASAARS